MDMTPQEALDEAIRKLEEEDENYRTDNIEVFMGEGRAELDDEQMYAWYCLPGCLPSCDPRPIHEVEDLIEMIYLSE